MVSQGPVHPGLPSSGSGRSIRFVPSRSGGSLVLAAAPACGLQANGARSARTQRPERRARWAPDAGRAVPHDSSGRRFRDGRRGIRLPIWPQPSLRPPGLSLGAAPPGSAPRLSAGLCSAPGLPRRGWSPRQRRRRGRSEAGPPLPRSVAPRRLRAATGCRLLTGHERKRPPISGAAVLRNERAPWHGARTSERVELAFGSGLGLPSASLAAPTPRHEEPVQPVRQRQRDEHR
jgi:hypothetical protein